MNLTQDYHKRTDDGTLSFSLQSGKPGVSDPAVYRNRLLVQVTNNFCRICRMTGHWSIDCPRKPCFICRMEGHTATVCPYRTIPGDSFFQAKRHFSAPSNQILEHVRSRESPCSSNYRYPALQTKQVSLQVSRAILRLHLGRVTCLEFHPRHPSLVFSGDKKGLLANWNFESNSYQVNSVAHMYLIHGIAFDDNNDNRMFTASADGQLIFHDIETTKFSTLLNANPNRWEGPNTWCMLCSVAYNSDGHVILAGDNFGNVHMVDDRISMESNQYLKILAHKKKTKVTGVSIHPRDSHLLLTCGNDYFMRLWDARMFSTDLHLTQYEHPRVVNAAYFSPLYGNKILSTCQDNRLRVWDNVHQPLEKVSKEIIHSHDFNRYLSPFKAVWDPKDWREDLILCGRYIGEDYYDPKMQSMIRLHAVDLYSASTGHIVSELVDLNVPTISPLNKVELNLYLWEDLEHGKNKVTDGRFLHGKNLSSRAQDRTLLDDQDDRFFLGRDSGDSDDDSDDSDDDSHFRGGARLLARSSRQFKGDLSLREEDSCANGMRKGKSLARRYANFMAFQVPENVSYKQRKEKTKGGPRELNDED
eukprot:jgi/Galph1/1967/GphlegSOOS_G636.1